MLIPSQLDFDEDEDVAELLRALPEVRENLGSGRRDEELGLRSLLEWPNPAPRTRTKAA
jgi:hypothetical protein